LQLDPSIHYDLVIQTTPPIEKDQLMFSGKKSESIDIPASQGFLRVELTGALINNNLNSKIKCLVKKESTGETVAVMDMNTTMKFLSGAYKLEVLTIPRMQIDPVNIKQSSTTTVKIEVPGVLNLVKTFAGYGAIFITEKGRFVKIYELNENLTNELVGLQAGEYTVIFRNKSSKKTSESITRKFQIKSGESLQLKL